MDKLLAANDTFPDFKSLEFMGHEAVADAQAWFQFLCDDMLSACLAGYKYNPLIRSELTDYCLKKAEERRAAKQPFDLDWLTNQADNYMKIEFPKVDYLEAIKDA